MSKEVPALPSATNVDAATPRLTLGEDAKITFDHLGPIVVSEDGTLSRIGNWESLSEREREVAKRRIAKRNNERLAVLRAKESGGGS
ncbi:unnamed product [Ostreococcus tauri]|uniref:Unnamed product n=1 Tax=Ostreococcus tauri TaxID=70448 RepID=A0A096PA24_OSTTA|nr:unnamed product [Ostreococcus tauri]CEG01241.1 unnamed product [Ostreococcus tauri]|eukprot:XP_022840862.1 unnamed product [Ostreococcus tauri]